MLNKIITPALIFLFHSAAYACDPCTLYNASRLQGPAEGAVNLAVSEQYTEFDLAENTNPNSTKYGDFVKGFSTTQFALNYDLSANFGFQINLPLIGRYYNQVSQYRSDDETDVKLGDMSLSGTYSFINCREADWSAISGFTFGVKLPTGETGVLDEVDDSDSSEELILKHHTISTGSGGRALTFGTGSYDYIFGINSLLRRNRYLMLSNLQYTIRTEGDFNYEFADDLLFSAAPGYYILLDHDFTLAAAVSLSGEFKDKDKQNGQQVTGSAYSNLYLGPSFFITSGENIGFEIGMDFRVTGEDAGAIIVPDQRFKTSLSYRFG